ncbi:putative transcription factor bHLH041 isoform X3 [Arachis stenosperma]|uniref:putative transcription factor bHLH041 isoform X3 n=1 Tax=Arachis stenosperma TaxID=217475 RepID=UPI0025AD00A7|nr:putative transcription factor bHLH041 isoform X3 [Arachis stenosperma]
MDGVFNLPEATRSDFLRSLMHTFGCTYICLWHCHSSSKCSNLLFLDGIYNNVNSTIAEETLFNLYQRLTFDAANDEYVGSWCGFQEAYGLLRASTIGSSKTCIRSYPNTILSGKTAIFMGCSKGEIELGFSTIPQIDMKAAVKSLFPEDFSREQIHHPASSSSCSCPSDEFSSLRGVLLPAPEGEQEAIIRAILHVVISSSSSPATTTSQPPPYNNSAFRAYSSTAYNLVTSSSSRRFSLMKRSIEFSRTLHLMRIRDRFHFQRQHQPPHPLIIGTQNANNNNHLHRIISERRRRENENKCFRELRALLPPGTKKHKSSVLIAAKEALKSLIAEIEKLNIRNQQLKTLLGSSSSSYVNVHISSSPSSSNERLNVAVSHVAGSSSSEERMVDLQVAVRGESSSHHHQSDIMIRILEFLKSLQNLSFVSMAANTTTNTQGTTITQIIFRIRILQGSEWDESGFVEAVRRVVSNLA